MREVTPRLAVLWLSIVFAALCSGCVTSKKYRLAAEDTLPPVALDWNVAAHEASLVVKHVIVFKGPGSWKREARWDEYVVEVKNAGATPLTIESAELIDLLGEPQVPGSDPWELERRSYTNWDKYGKKGVYLLAGAGAVVIFAGAATAAALSSAMSGGAAAGGAVAVLNVIPVVAIVDVAVVASMNHANKNKVVAEFARRRMALPCEVASGQAVTGSWFFPMTPAPRELVVRARRGGEAFDLHVSLPELEKLHLRPDAKVAR